MVRSLLASEAHHRCCDEHEAYRKIQVKAMMWGVPGKNSVLVLF